MMHTQYSQNHLPSYIDDQLFGNARYSYSDNNAHRWPQINYETFKSYNDILTIEKLNDICAELKKTYISEMSNLMQFNRNKIKPVGVILHVTDNWKNLFAYKKSFIAGITSETYSNSIWGRFYVTEDERQDLIKDIERLSGFRVVMTGKFYSSGFSDIGYYYTVVTENKSQEEIDEIAKMTMSGYSNELVYLKREVDTMINQVDPFTLRQIKNMILHDVCSNRNCKTSVETMIKRYSSFIENEYEKEGKVA